MEIRHARHDDLRACATLAATVVGPQRAPALIQAAFDRRQLLVASDTGGVVGFLAYRSDWFNCTFVTLVGVTPERHRNEVAQALYRAVEAVSPSPRLFSSTEETDAAAIRMHSALGFTWSGYVDNLPQGYRELIFFKRLAVGSGISDGEPSHV